MGSRAFGRLLAAVVGLTLAAVAPAVAAAATYTVTSTADTGGPCAAVCTLRGALQDAGASPGHDSVVFALPGAGVQTIALLSPLPRSGDVDVDARTQPGYAGSPLVRLDATALVGGEAVVLLNDASLRGFAIGGNPNVVGVAVVGHGNTVEANSLTGNDTGVLLNVESGFTGGGNTVAGNAVSGSRLVGIDGSSTAGHDTIQGNTVTGSGQDGIAVNGAANTISGNTVTTSGRFGILLADQGHNVVTGNVVHDQTRNAGIAISGSSGNVVDGNDVYANSRGIFTNSGPVSSATISHNSVHGNATFGIGVTGGAAVSGVTISENAITGNGALGIDLLAAGTNGGRQAPAIAAAAGNAHRTTASGTVQGPPATAMHVELFSNAGCDASGFGEGATFLGSTTVTTDASGSASWTIVGAARPAGQDQATATSTDAAGNTSEFSRCAAVAAAPSATVSPASIDFGSVAVGSAPQTQNVTVTNDGTLPVTVGPATLAGNPAFSATSCSSSTLAPGASCTIAVTYSPPASAGTQTGTLHVSTTGGDYDVALGGTTVAAPGSADDAYSTTSGGTLVVPAPGVLANDTDPAGSGLTAELVTGPSHGVLALSGDGSFTYVADAAFAGTDSFTYRSRSAFGVSAPATVRIVVADTTPPVFGPAADIVVNATSPSGAAVSYTLPTATDAVDPHPTVTCTPPPGPFAIGTTHVTCTATDASHNTATTSFDVTVRGAGPQIADLIEDTLTDLRLVPGLKPAAKQLLETAASALASHKPQLACNLLRSYDPVIRGIPAKFLPTAQRNDLLADAARIRAVLGC